MIRTTTARLVVALLFATSARSPAITPDRVAEASSGKAPRPGDLVFFPLDDESIPWRHNLKLVLQQPVKYAGNPVMTPSAENGPDGFGTVLYGTVLKQDGKFRMWYLANQRIDSRIPGDDKRMVLYRPIAYAESTDGIPWRKPDLGLVEFRGSKHNNLVSIEPASEPYARIRLRRGVLEARRSRSTAALQDGVHHARSPA